MRRRERGFEHNRLRRRVQLSLEGHTTAGPRGSYMFHGLTASPDVKDIAIGSPGPGEVAITVLGAGGDGTPPDTLLYAVDAALNAEDVRPLTDQVRVRAATIIPYRLEARLTLYDGAEAQAARAQAVAAVQGFVSDHHRLGHDITLSGLHAALHGRGVQNVRLTRPATDIVVGPAEAAYCTAITVTVGGHDV